ncbi:hypothetical protein [Cellvibrio sp. PSBB006]|uniref:hypothetical protein n=1 Tax=Cellvibrio sp. PSBB006 TaxID=1987723 RepID=UPI000B3B82AC|nr:hypothetical protein [Cellvibrio sp. PSBB006]ARU28133.1 hypothetical protein CBR65_12250 [Cellvibrio sp. PSBB006]
MKSIAISIFLSLITLEVVAETVSGEIARIYPSVNKIHFKLKNDQCGKPISSYYTFELDSEYKKAWYAMLLAAANTGKPIRASIPGCPVNDEMIPVNYIVQDF